jgi:hypothetical protein
MNKIEWFLTGLILSCALTLLICTIFIEEQYIKPCERENALTEDQECVLTVKVVDRE